MTLTPKKDFQGKKQFADAHRELVVSTQFREALHASLLDYVLSLPTTVDQSEAAAYYQRIDGAQLFVQYLLNLAEIPKSLPATPPANLDHSIR